MGKISLVGGDDGFSCSHQVERFVSEGFCVLGSDPRFTDFSEIHNSDFVVSDLWKRIQPQSEG